MNESSRTALNGKPSQLRPLFRVLVYGLVAVFAVAGTAGFVLAAIQSDSSLAAASLLNWGIAIGYWRLSSKR